jgi:hypothetical protein
MLLFEYYLSFVNNFFFLKPKKHHVCQKMEKNKKIGMLTK